MATLKFEDVKDDDEIIVDASEMGYSEVAVKTTHKEIMEMYNSPEKECKICMRGAWKATRNVDIETIINDDERWGNFCNDVVIYFACRYKLKGILIPICVLPVSNDLD